MEPPGRVIGRSLWWGSAAPLRRIPGGDLDRTRGGDGSEVWRSAYGGPSARPARRRVGVEGPSVGSDLGVAVARLILVVHLGELPLELELDLFFVVFTLVFDADGRALRHADALADDLDAERPVCLASANRRSFSANWVTV